MVEKHILDVTLKEHSILGTGSALRAEGHLFEMEEGGVLQLQGHRSILTDHHRIGVVGGGNKGDGAVGTGSGNVSGKLHGIIDAGGHLEDYMTGHTAIIQCVDSVVQVGVMRSPAADIVGSLQRGIAGNDRNVGGIVGDIRIAVAVRILRPGLDVVTAGRHGETADPNIRHHIAISQRLAGGLPFERGLQHAVQHPLDSDGRDAARTHVTEGNQHGILAALHRTVHRMGHGIDLHIVFGRHIVVVASGIGDAGTEQTVHVLSHYRIGRNQHAAAGRVEIAGGDIGKERLLPLGVHVVADKLAPRIDVRSAMADHFQVVERDVVVHGGTGIQVGAVRLMADAFGHTAAACHADQVLLGIEVPVGVVRVRQENAVARPARVHVDGVVTHIRHVERTGINAIAGGSALAFNDDFVVEDAGRLGIWDTAVDALAEIEGIAAAGGSQPEAVPGHGVNSDIGNHVTIAERTVGAGVGGIVEIVVTDGHPVIAVGALETVVIAVQQLAAVNLQRAEGGGGTAAAVVELDVRIAAVNQALFEAQLLEGLAGGRVFTEDHIGLAVLAAMHGIHITMPEGDIRQGVLDDHRLHIAVGVTDADFMEAEVAGIHQPQGGGDVLPLQHDIPALAGGGSEGHDAVAASSGEGAFEFDILIHPFSQAHLHRTAHTALVKGEYSIGQGGEVATGTHGVAA